MKTRIDRVRRNESSEALHVWGPDFERCALAAEVAGIQVVRLESGGFFTETSEIADRLLSSGRFDIQHERLSWDVVSWRETGRMLFRETVVDLEEEEHSLDPAWGTQDMASRHALEMESVVSGTAARLRVAATDDVLVMCCWRVFERERGLLTARYGLNITDSDLVNDVLEQLKATGEDLERLQQLRVASLAWW
ncbi:MAG: hypothetical protein VXW32_13365 [Myxococcota bacterium]|nr:hypothetical protein [Myxococcota bacterium]